MCLNESWPLILEAGWEIKFVKSWLWTLRSSGDHVKMWSAERVVSAAQVSPFVIRLRTLKTIWKHCPLLKNQTEKLLGACGDPSLPPHDSHHRRCFLHPGRASLSLGHWGHSCRLHQARPLWRQHNHPQHLRRVSYRYNLWSFRSNSVMIIPAWSGFSPPSPLVASTTLPTLTSASSTPSRCCGGCNSRIISDLFWKLIHVRKKVLFYWYPWRRFVMIAPPPHQLKLLKYLMMR